MTNRDIGEVLEEIASLMEFQGAEFFRVRAYRRAADAIAHAPFQIDADTPPGKLTDLDGVGGSIADAVLQIAETGTCDQREELMEDFPEGLLDVLKVPGVGPKRAALFFREAGVHDLTTLRQAAEDGRLAELEGMGEKSQQNVLKGLETLEGLSDRMLMGQAWERADPLVEDLGGAGKVHVAGSLRRGRETIGDLDLLTTTENSEATEKLKDHELVEEVRLSGETKTTVIVRGGIQVDLRIIDPRSIGAGLLYFTGSKEHNVRLREIAQSKGWKLSEYGLFEEGADEPFAGETEEEIYDALGLKWIPPELREDSGEIKAAKESSLPQLIEREDVRGDTHCHSTWSDGRESIEDMALSAEDLGLEYIVMTDHSKALGVTGGLNEERLLEQGEEIDELNESLDGIRVLKGVEVDVLSDGSLDISEEVLEGLDWVNASLHSGLSQTREKVTDRTVKAALSPHVDVISHPLGRLLGQRESMEIDFEAVLDACEEGHTALEINCSSDRLDLPDHYARQAADRGIPIVIGTDAHASAHRENLRYGVATARRAWLTKDQVLNCLSAGDLLEWAQGE
ncbi:MAG: DNA polymerase/3'-5' exonuclease PolX [Armatimonadia bacterium]|nr:DNA polymerase/3'-5' exonuclease PolX [Armatimonadia bacterium]